MSNEIIQTFGPKLPLMGVCLGHQCIAHSFGAEVVVNDVMMHGKTSPITHDGKDLFEGIPSPFTATRCHSLVVKRDTVPDCLEITSETEAGEIMGLRHRITHLGRAVPSRKHPDRSRPGVLRNFLKLG